MTSPVGERIIHHMMNKAAVEVAGLHVRRGKTVVFDGTDLTIPQGEITGLLGPSGCGKTTLMLSLIHI